MYLLQPILTASIVLILQGSIASCGVIPFRDSSRDLTEKKNSERFQQDNVKNSIEQPGHDFIYNSPTRNILKLVLDDGSDTEFKYKYVSYCGEVSDAPGDGLLEVSATLSLPDDAHNVGTEIVRLMTQYMPDEIFYELSQRASVGLFTTAETVTVFPEFKENQDRPECYGRCFDGCGATCTFDGRKYDTLVGLGGSRAVCRDDNFMCYDSDLYGNHYSVLVHEFAHTIHQYSLPAAANEYYTKINTAYENAKANSVWDLRSYAMANSLEYFAEGTGVFFNTNNHPSSSGGMNSCGQPFNNFCASEADGRNWLRQKDPLLFDILAFVYTTNQPSLPSNLRVCMTK